jgi:hypothetical protein
MGNSSPESRQSCPPAMGRTRKFAGFNVRVDQAIDKDLSCSLPQAN